MRVTYVVTCGSAPPPGLHRAERDASLWGQLQAGTMPGLARTGARQPEQAGFQLAR